MKIQELPAEARSKLQSGLIITDAVQLALELVHNSLDAEASGIAVRIDLKSYQIRVIDNGKGIGREDFELVGEKFMTSKYQLLQNLDSTFATYGYRGQALSSIREICKTLKIESKSETDGPTVVKVFQNNVPSKITEVISERNGTGTTVTVEDFMCTMPIRRKRINEVFDMEEIKSQLQYLAIMHYNVCFTLRNDNKGIILLQTPQASDLLESVSNIFGKTVAKSLKDVYYKEEHYEVTGYISLRPQIQSNVQLLYINKRIITKGVTHKFINRVIKKYVGKNILCADSPRAQVLKSLRNSCQNIFILEIRCPHSYYELFTNMRKTTVEFENWKDVLKCLHKAVKRAFKEVLNLDSSSNIQEKYENNNNEKDKCRGIFGTSVLMNAVKGAAVKRGLTNKKDQKKKKKRRLNEIQDKLQTPQTDNKKEHLNQLLTDSSNIKQISHDSLESPIPKCHFKCAKLKNVDVKSTATLNQSFFEFYEWVKKKFETDKNLYNDFLQFRNGVNDSTHPTGVAEFKSPVVGGKLKRRKLASPKNLKKKQGRKENRCLSAIDEKMAIVTHQQLKIFPSNHLRMNKLVQMNKDFHQYLDFDCVKTQRTSIFKEPYNTQSLSVPQEQVELKHSLPSLASSEIQLTNGIKFRNWSESFFQLQPPDIYKDIPSENTLGSGSGTWASHYRDAVSKNAENHGQRCRVTSAPLCRSDDIQKDENVEACKYSKFQKTQANITSNEITTKKNVFQDVEIQVNVSKIPLEKVNATTQTSPAAYLVQECPSFKSSDGLNQRIWKATPKNNEVNQPGRSDPSQEVANADFWNASAQGYYNNNLEQFCSQNKIVTKIPTPGLMNEKNSMSSEFLCGQKSTSVIKLQNEGSISKETQTLAAFWADSLIEIMNTHPEADSSSKSESPLTKTIPVEEIESSILQPIKSGFCLTQRHDFIPKGLSPPFFKTEISGAFKLSPHEKFRIKKTVDNAQSDLLTNVKWQDESTGDYLKPIIPDGILDEMRQKAVKNMLDFENSVLSASLSYCAVKIHSLLHSFTFTKELLSGVEILGQLDRKFIVTKMKLSTPKKMELISLFDQHAVDERIKLEELIKDYSMSDGKFIGSRLNPSVECALSEFDVQVLRDLNEKLLNFGLDVKVVNENTVSINEIPSFLLNKHKRDLKNKKDIPLSDVVRDLIVNIAGEMRETRGVLPKIPKVMHNAFCAEACHKAIKFNRPLSVENMTEMIDKLKSCKLPFQCAHGRPSVIPIIDLEDFQPMMETNESVELERLNKFRATRRNI